MLHDQLAQELAIEPMQVVDRVQDAEARANAEEQRYLAETGLEVDDHRRSFAQPRQLDAAIHRERGRARATFRAEEHERGRRRTRPLRGFEPSRRAPDRAVKRFVGRRICEELVGAGPHRVQDQFGVGGERDGENCDPW